MAKWRVIYRAKKSPYVVGLQKRRGIKISPKPNTVIFTSNHITTRQEALIEFKKMFTWARIISLKKERKSGGQG